MNFFAHWPQSMLDKLCGRVIILQLLVSDYYKLFDACIFRIANSKWNRLFMGRLMILYRREKTSDPLLEY
jgi:hypothetical protein